MPLQTTVLAIAVALNDCISNCGCFNLTTFFCNGTFSPPATATYFFRFAVLLALRQPRGDMTHIDQDLSAALYLLGFSLLRGDLGEIAEIKGEMTIKLVHPPGEELKFVVELPGDKQLIFSVDRHQIVDLAERWQ